MKAKVEACLGGVGGCFYFFGDDEEGFEVECKYGRQTAYSMVGPVYHTDRVRQLIPVLRKMALCKTRRFDTGQFFNEPSSVRPGIFLVKYHLVTSPNRHPDVGWSGICCGAILRCYVASK
jgi:hypothetical protein